MVRLRWPPSAVYAISETQTGVGRFPSHYVRGHDRGVRKHCVGTPFAPAVRATAPPASGHTAQRRAGDSVPPGPASGGVSVQRLARRLRMIARSGHLLRVYWLEVLMVLPLTLYIGLLTFVPVLQSIG